MIKEHRRLVRVHRIRLAHGGFSPDNVLVDEPGRITAVLDRESTKGGPPDLDIGWWDCFVDSSLTPVDALVEGHERHAEVDRPPAGALLLVERCSDEDPGRCPDEVNALDPPFEHGSSAAATTPRDPGAVARPPRAALLVTDDPGVRLTGRRAAQRPPAGAGGCPEPAAHRCREQVADRRRGEGAGGWAACLRNSPRPHP